LRAVPGTKSMKHALSPDEIARAADLASKLSMPSLAKAWQILLKGLSEVQMAPNPQSAAEMVLIRLSYAADLPDPAQLLKTLKDMPTGQGAVPDASPVSGGGNASTPVGGGGVSGGGAHVPAEAPRGGSSGDGPRAALAIVPKVEPTPVIAIKTLADVVAVLEQDDEILLASNVFHYVHLVKLGDQLLDIRPEEHAPPKLTQDLGQALTRITGNRWIVSVSGAPGQLTLAEQEQALLEQERQEILQLPIMRDIMEMFPEATIEAINKVDERKE